MSLGRKAHDLRSVYSRAGDRAIRPGLIVQHPAAETRHDGAEDGPEPDSSSPIGVLDRRLHDDARLEGVRLAARELAHLVNNDLAVAVGLVDLVQGQPELPTHLRDLLAGAATSLDAAARHVREMQSVVRVVVKETPAGQSLDLERSTS